MRSRSFDALQRSLAKGDLQPVYYFHGDEDLLKDEAVRRILELATDAATRDFNLDRRRAPDLAAEEFQTLVDTPPMLAARRAVVLGEAESLQLKRPRTQALRAAVVEYLEHPSPETVLVLVQSAGERPDPELERGACAVDFETLPPERVGRWIRHRAAAEGLELEDDAARHLQDALGDDLPQLAAELAKLAAATGGRTATVADVADLLGVRHGETIHDLVDAVSSRRFVAAAGMVPHLVASPGVGGVRLLNALGTALVGLALARAWLDARDAPATAADRVLKAIYGARPMGLRSWKEEAARFVRDAAGWTAAELDEGLATLLRADARLKETRLSGDAEVVAEAVLTLGASGRKAA
jgi:DNA polymerase-3 subunit delta